MSQEKWGYGTGVEENTESHEKWEDFLESSHIFWVCGHLADELKQMLNEEVRGDNRTKAVVDAIRLLLTYELQIRIKGIE